MNPRGAAFAQIDTSAPYDEARARGERICRWCGKPLPPRRHKWCSDECAHTYFHELPPRTQGELRSKAERRDHGICAVCGLDCERALEAIRWQMGQFNLPMWEVLANKTWDAFVGPLSLNRSSGYNPYRACWDAHHVVPLKDGGSAGLENTVTLCIWCHKKAHAGKLRLRTGELFGKG